MEHCAFCGLLEDWPSRNTTDMPRNYSLWPVETTDLAQKVAGPYDYVEYIKPDWLKDEVKRLFFQPMPAGNAWPDQHSVYNSMGNQSSAVPTLVNEELHYNGSRINNSQNSSYAMLTAPQALPAICNTTQTSPSPPLLQAWNEIVARGKKLTITIDATKYKTREECDSSPEAPEDSITTGGDMTESSAWCEFCFKNGETTSFVSSHNLRDPKTKKVLCPVLRAYRCEYCQATGDKAHTRTYCPLVRNLEGKVCSTTIALKSTKRQANGKIRVVKPHSNPPVVGKKKTTPCIFTESFSYLTAH